jgi:murein hydrolase activator
MWVRGRMRQAGGVRAALILGALALVGSAAGAQAGANAPPAPPKSMVAAAAAPAKTASLANALAALSLADRANAGARARQDAPLAAAVAGDLARLLTQGGRIAAARAAPPSSAFAPDQTLGALLDSADLSAVLIPFGTQGRNGRLSTGVTFAVAPGSQIYAPQEAAVGFAGPLGDYGGVVILLTGEEQAFVITGLANLAVREGQRVAAGALLGASPTAESAPPNDPQRARLTTDATPAPELYLEVRRDGRFIDPQRWLRSQR